MTDERRAVLSRVESQEILARARAARARLSDILDRLVASNAALDPFLLRELGRFLDEEGYAAADAYRLLVEMSVGHWGREEPALSGPNPPSLAR